mmetsp:Transcript_4686/g.19263  ORF Transcript_4686/g.19263 Transcript_4686/m.19263 type:complete len:360 (+) Transcript_4686:184-1263(+)
MTRRARGWLSSGESDGRQHPPVNALPLQRAASFPLRRVPLPQGGGSRVLLVAKRLPFTSRGGPDSHHGGRPDAPEPGSRSRVQQGGPRGLLRAAARPVSCVLVHVRLEVRDEILHARDGELELGRGGRLLGRLVRPALLDVGDPPVPVDVHVVLHDLRDAPDPAEDLTHRRHLRRPPRVAAEVHHRPHRRRDELRSIPAHLHVLGDDVHGVAALEQRPRARPVRAEVFKQRVRGGEHGLVRARPVAPAHRAEQRRHRPLVGRQLATARATPPRRHRQVAQRVANLAEPPRRVKGRDGSRGSGAEGSRRICEASRSAPSDERRELGDPRADGRVCCDATATAPSPPTCLDDGSGATTPEA